MKVCRLKIITGNIFDGKDFPQIHYVSQNKKLIIIKNNIEEKKIVPNIEENINQKENLAKARDEKSQETKEIIPYIDNNPINNNENRNELNNINKNNIEANIDINDLCTISNKNLYEEQKINNVLNYIEKNNNEKNNLNNNYPYEIMSKKKGVNNYLRYLFKNRQTKAKIKSDINKNINKSLSISNNRINHKISKINSKSNLNLNQSNNKSYMLKNIKSSDSIALTKSKKVILNQSLNIHNKTKKNLLKSKKVEYHRRDYENGSSNDCSWKISEKNDYNIGQIIDYKLLIDGLIIKECQLIKEKEQFMQIFEQKLKPLRELNNQLMNENNEELNRTDELKGELILLKSQYEKLFNTLNPKDKNKVNNKNVKNNDEEEEFHKKKKDIDYEIKILNDQLKNGEFILITKPANYNKLSEEENKTITLLLKALFVSKHILDSNIIIDRIWKFDKQFQTIYFMVEELLNYFNLELHDRNKLINYFFSFCQNYNYMDINQFKKEFKKKIGKIKLFNKYIYMSKLLNYYKSKIKLLLKSISKKDLFNRGFINYYEFINLLYDCGIIFNSSDTNSEEIFEFLIFCMKKNRRVGFFEKDNEFFINQNEQEKKYSLFDLFYQSLDDFINEFESNDVKNPYYLIRSYMKENEIINAENLIKPILTEKNILTINSVKYIDIIILNKFLRFKGIIKNDDKIVVNFFEEELVDINEFINDIYNEENNEEKKQDYEELKIKANNLIDDILKLNY